MAVTTTRYKGTSAHDLFELDMLQLASAQIAGGLGTDTLKITTTGSYVFSSASYRGLSGVDSFDFSSHLTGTLEVRLTSGMMSQTDAGRLTIVSGASGIDVLKAGASVGGTVYIAGIGVVQLDHATNNFVSIADGAFVHVKGGNGSDTIRASATGSILDGGAGNDTLVAGNGTDSVRFGTGDRADLVQSFNAAQDVVVLEGTGFTYMSEIALRLTDTASGARLDLGNGDTLTFAGISAADLGAGNFSGIAAGAPTIVVAPGTTADQLQAILDGAGAGATVILAEGSHVFNHSIVIRHDGVTLRGASETGTVVVFDYPAGTGGDGIVVRAGAESFLGTATADIARGSTSLVMSAISGLEAGDTIRIYQDNDAAYLAANGWSNADPALLASHPFREVIAQIDHIAGNTVYLKSAIPFAMTGGLARVNAIDLVRDVRLSDMTVTYALGEPNAFDFANTHPAFDGAAAVRFDGTHNAVIENLSILDSASLALDVRSSLSISVDDIYIDGAHNKGSDGNGYGLEIQETFESSFTNLEIFNTRHAVLFSSWDAEANNVVHVLDTNRDVNFHGSDDVANTVIVDRAVLAYDQSQNSGTGNGYWAVVSDGGTSHTRTDIYGGNSVLFAYARGSDAADEIHGTHAGAYLNGMNGQDILVGGSGSDIFVGGLNKDRMTGGAGADQFLFRVGDNYDTITDFDASVGSDVLVLSGTASLDAVSDLTITQDGANVLVRYGANATIIIEGRAVADIGAHCFVFDPTGQQVGSLF